MPARSDRDGPGQHAQRSHNKPPSALTGRGGPLVFHTPGSQYSSHPYTMIRLGLHTR